MRVIHMVIEVYVILSENVARNPIYCDKNTWHWTLFLIHSFCFDKKHFKISFLISHHILLFNFILIAIKDILYVWLTLLITVLCI